MPRFGRGSGFGDQSEAGGVSHAKLREVIVADFFQLWVVEAELGGYNACFFCLGVSSIGLSKQACQKVTYDLTLSVAH
jgi:hypothetical protein